MEMKEHLINMAHYNKWAFEKLYLSLAAVNNQEYYRDHGMFFKSIHKTLNHLYIVDLIWFSRFNNTDCEIKKLDLELITDRQELEKSIVLTCDSWINFLNRLDKCPEWLHFKRTTGESSKRPYLPALAHVFNHATHHRGQITTIISQLNLSTPEMDYTYYLAEHM